MASTTLGGAGALSWARPPGASPQFQQQQVHFPIRINRLTLTIRRSGSSSSQENSVSTQPSEQEQAAGDAPEQSEASTAAEEKPSEEQQKKIGDALKELRSKDSSSDFWSGLVQEIELIEWPDFGRVFGTTVVVLGIIFGSSIVLLTVNFLLAQLSDIVFKVKSTQ